MAWKLYPPTPHAAPPVKRQQLLPIAEERHRRRLVRRAALRAHQAAKPRVAPVGREQTLALDLLRDPGGRRPPPGRCTDEHSIPAVAVAHDEGQHARL